MKNILTGILMIGLLAACVSGAMGCVGSRPLAMGGAFIGLADDANTTYWNPAGLAQMPLGETTSTWTHTSTNRDEVNYQDFGSLAGSAGMPRIGKLALGASYVRDDMGLQLGDKRVLDKQDWVWASLAMDAGKYGMLGLNIRKIDDAVAGCSVHTDVGLDVGYLYHVDSRLSVGMLIQDINTPEMTMSGFGSTNRIRNIRAGLAFRPNKDTVVTVDGYDLANNGDALSARFGIERKFGGFALRGGYYGLGGGTDSGATFGVGLDQEAVTFDATVMTGDFDNTVMLSATYKAL